MKIYTILVLTKVAFLLDYFFLKGQKGFLQRIGKWII